MVLAPMLTRLLVPAVLVAFAGFARTASAATFTDPAAHVFTLVPGGSISALVVIPSGDAVFAVRGRHDISGDRPGRLMRLADDGTLRQVREDGASALAVESADT